MNFFHTLGSYELYGFGMNTYNQLFQAAAGGDVTTPTKVSHFLRAVQTDGVFWNEFGVTA